MNRTVGDPSPLVIVAEGLRRIWHAPALLAGLWLITLLTALPLALGLRAAIAADLGASMAADAAARGVNWDWWQEFTFRHPSLRDSFQPFVIGFGAVLQNVSALVDAQVPAWPVAGAAMAYLLGWTFLLGGILDRYARGRRTGAHGFFAAAGVFFFRFLRLGVIAALVWAFLFGVVHAGLFDRFHPWVTRDLTVERTAFAWYVALQVIFLLLLGALMLVFDYAKVRAVVEDRRSMVGAIAAAARFVRRYPAATLIVFAVNVLLFVLVVSAYALLARGAAGGDLVSLVLSFAVTQLYVVGRLVVKLSFYASAIALFQSRLAHAEYTARPTPVWPDSPAVESIVPMAPRSG